MKFIIQTVIFAAIYFIYLSTFLTVSIQKIKSGPQDWFLKQFNGTIIEKLPGGAKFGFWFITILETSVSIFLILALFNGEWTLTKAHLFWLPLGISVAALTFSLLGFGLRISNDFQGASNLFSYFGASIVVLIFLQSHPYTFIR